MVFSQMYLQTVWMVEKNTSSLLIILSLKLRSGRMVQWYEASLFTLEDVEVQVQIVFLLGPFPFILTADPFTYFWSK